MSIVITQAEQADLNDLLVLVTEYAEEIATQEGLRDFVYDKEKARERLSDFLDYLEYGAFIARSPKGHLIGFCTLFAMPVQIREEPYAYFERLYVRPAFRRRQIGHELCAQAKRFAKSRKGKRMEVKMPAFYRVPEVYDFFKSERFYETGGHKLKIAL